GDSARELLGFLSAQALRTQPRGSSADLAASRRRLRSGARPLTRAGARGNHRAYGLRRGEARRKPGCARQGSGMTILAACSRRPFGLPRPFREEEPMLDTFRRAAVAGMLAALVTWPQATLALDKVRLGKAVPNSFAFGAAEVGIEAKIFEK